MDSKGKSRHGRLTVLVACMQDFRCSTVAAHTLLILGMGIIQPYFEFQ